MDDRSSLWAVKLTNIFRETAGKYANTVTFSISPKIGVTENDALAVGVGLPEDMARGEYWWLKNDDVGTTSVTFTREDVDEGDGSVYLIVGDQYGEELDRTDLADYIELMFDSYDLSINDDLEVDYSLYLNGSSENILAVSGDYKPVAMYYDGNLVPNVSATPKKDYSSARSVSFNSKYNSKLLDFEIKGKSDISQYVYRGSNIFNREFIALRTQYRTGRGIVRSNGVSITYGIIYFSLYIGEFDKSATESTQYGLRVSLEESYDPSDFPLLRDIEIVAPLHFEEDQYILHGFEVTENNGRTYVSDFLNPEKSGTTPPYIRLTFNKGGAEFSEQEMQNLLNALKNVINIEIWHYVSSTTPTESFKGFPGEDGAVRSPTLWCASSVTPFNNDGTTIELSNSSGEETFFLAKQYYSSNTLVNCLLRGFGDFCESVKLSGGNLTINNLFDTAKLGTTYNWVYTSAGGRKFQATIPFLVGADFVFCKNLRSGIDYDVNFTSGVFTVYADSINAKRIEEFNAFLVGSGGIDITYANSYTDTSTQIQRTYPDDVVRGVNTITLSTAVSHDPKSISVTYFD